MILNETLLKHKECLEQCEREQIACEVEQEDDQKCKITAINCECDCDFDYGP